MLLRCCWWWKWWSKFAIAEWQRKTKFTILSNFKQSCAMIVQWWGKLSKFYLPDVMVTARENLVKLQMTQCANSAKVQPVQKAKSAKGQPSRWRNPSRNQHSPEWHIIVIIHHCCHNCFLCCCRCCCCWFCCHLSSLIPTLQELHSRRRAEQCQVKQADRLASAESQAFNFFSKAQRL